MAYPTKRIILSNRLKSKNPDDLLNGIEYIEIRTVDINPFLEIELVKQDMKIHIQCFLETMKKI